MNRSINRRLLLVALIVVVLTGCDAFNKTAEEYLSASRAYYEKGEYTASLIEIKNAIQQSPFNPEVRLLSARIYLKLGKGGDAAIQLAKAASLGADGKQVIPLQAHVLFQQHKFKELLDLEIPDNLDAAQLSDIYAYQGFAAAELKDQATADRLYQQSLELNANSRLAYRGIALLYTAQRKYQEALELIGKLLDKQPDDSETWSLQGDTYMANQQYDLAYKSYTNAAELDSEHRYPFLAKRALTCLSSGDLDCAEKDLAELENNVPGYYMTAYINGLLAVKQQRWKDAESALSGALAINPELTPAYYFSGLSQFQQQQYGPAITRLTTFVARKPKSENGRHLLSLAQMKAGHLESARATLQPVIEQGHPASPILYLLGQIEYGLGNIPDSIRYFKQLSRRHPESALVHAQLGRKLLASGNMTAGQKELATAINIAPDLFEAGQASVLAFLESKQFEKAQALIDKMQVDPENKAALLNLQGLLFLQKGEMKKAAHEFSQALKSSPGDPAASHYLAGLRLQQNDYQGAIHYYQNVLKIHPDNIPTHLKLATLNLKQGDELKAEQRLLELIKKQPQALGPRIMLAKYYLQNSRVDSVMDLLDPVADLYSEDPRLLTLKAESLLASGLTGSAKREAQILVSKMPDSADAQWLLARTAIADRDKLQGEQALKQTLLLKPDHIPAQVVQIKLLVEDRQFEQAEERLQKLLNQAPGDPRVGSIAAWLALVTEDYEQALSLYSKVYSISATSSNALGLAQAQWKVGRHQESVNTLRDWTMRHPDDVKAQFRLAIMYQMMGLDGDASARFARVLQFEPDNVVALNNLAWLLRNEDSAKALQYIEKAAELEPDNASVFDTLGVVLLQQGNTTRALRVLRRAFKTHPGHPAIQYHLALALYRNNKPEQAIDILEQLLGSFSEFNDKSQAQKLLNKLKISSEVLG